MSLAQATQNKFPRKNVLKVLSGKPIMKEKKMKKSRLLVCVDTLCKDQFSFLASPSGKMILFTKKKMTMEIPPFSTVVPML